MKTRPNGTGSIDSTPNGKWRARFAFDGKRRESIEGSPFATYAEAEAALDGVLALLAATPVKGMSLLRLGEKALAQRDREGYRSIADDRYMWDRHIATWDLATGPASLVTRGDIRELISGLRSKKTRRPLATQTKKNIRNMLSVVFAYGCEHEIINVNPCHDLKIKSNGTTADTSTFLDLDEANALIVAATDSAVAVAIGTGARSGELRSMLWRDVHVHGTAPHMIVRYGKPGEPPKNGRVRSVPLFGVALSALTTMHAKHYAQAIDPDVDAGALPVFPSYSGWHRQKGRVVEPDDWKAWKLVAGIVRPVRFHDLRHTCATLLLSGAWGRAWSYEEVKEMLGHSSVKVTERYAHAVGTLVSRAARTMRELVTSGSRDEDPVVTQAREIIGRCRWDLNPHMPVLQTGHMNGDSRIEVANVGNAWAIRAAIGVYGRAVVGGDPLAHARALDALELALDLLDRLAAVTRGQVAS